MVYRKYPEYSYIVYHAGKDTVEPYFWLANVSSIKTIFN